MKELFNEVILPVASIAFVGLALLLPFLFVVSYIDGCAKAAFYNQTHKNKITCFAGMGVTTNNNLKINED